MNISLTAVSSPLDDIGDRVVKLNTSAQASVASALQQDLNPRSFGWSMCALKVDQQGLVDTSHNREMSETSF